MIISSLIQTILSVPEFHRIGCKLQFTDYNRRSGINNKCLHCLTLPRRIPIHFYCYCMHMGCICQPKFLHFHGKLDSLLFEIHTQYFYFNNITDTDNFQRMLDVAVTHL